MFKKFLKNMLVFIAIIFLLFTSLYICLEARLNLWYAPVIFIGFIVAYFVIKISIRKVAYLRMKMKLSKEDFSGQAKDNLFNSFNSAIKYTKKYNKANKDNLPWMFLLGNNKSGKTSLLNPAEMSVDGVSTKYGFCWDNKNLVVAETSNDIFSIKPEKVSLRASDFLVSRVRKNKKDINLKGFIVAVSVAELLNPDEKTLAIYASKLRVKIDDISNKLGCSFPIYFVLTAADKIQGFEAFSAGLPDKLTKQPFGELFNDAGDNAVEQWLKNIVERIHVLNIHVLQTNESLAPRALLFERNIRNIQQGLTFFLESFYKEKKLNYEDSSVIRGIFLTSSRREMKSFATLDKGTMIEGLSLSEYKVKEYQKLYIRDLFSEVIPNDKYIVKPLLRKEKRIKTYKARLLAVWWALGLGLAGYVSYSYIMTIKTLNKILISTDVISKQFDNDFVGNLNLMNSMSQHITEIDEIKKKKLFSLWPYSVAIDDVEDNYKKRYVNTFNTHIISEMKKKTIENVEYVKSKGDKKYIGNTAENLIKAIMIIQSKQDGLSEESIRAIGLNQVIISKKDAKNNYGKLYRNYLLWNGNKEQLIEQKSTMESLLRSLNLFDTKPEWIIDWANHSDFDNDVEMGDYWPQASYKKTPVVDVAYQYNTYVQITTMLKNLSTISDFSKESESYVNDFLSNYSLQRYEAWQKFTKDFRVNRDTLPSKASWFTALEESQVGYPYMNYEKTVRNSFSQENDNSSTRPEWLKLFFTVGDYFNKTAYIAKAQTSTTILSKLNNYIDSFYTETSGSAFASTNTTMLVAVEDYQKKVLEAKPLVQSLDNETSFKAMESLVYKDNGSKAAKGVKSAYDAYDNIIVKSQMAWPSLTNNDNSVVWNFYRNGTDILLYGISQNTQCYIQDNWNSSLKGSDVALLDGVGADELYGEKSPIASFMKTNVAPFVEFNEDKQGFVSKSLHGQSVHFSPFAYKYLSSQRIYNKIGALEDKISQKMKSDGENISIKAMPTDVNKSAKLLPYKTTFKFVCNGKKQSFTNYNNINSFTLTSDIFSCTEADIDIEFDGASKFEVTKRYVGRDAVLQMIDDFSKNKEMKYQAKDLNGGVSMLRNYGIEYVTVEMNFGDLGLYDYLAEYSKYRENMMSYVKDIQNEEVANCWNSRD